MNEKLLANVRFYFAQSVFNSNCHFKAYGRLEKRKKKLSNFIVGISAATAVVLVLQVIGLQDGNQKLINTLAYIGMFLIAVSLVTEMFNKEDISLKMAQHKIFAEKYKSLRDEYMSLVEEIMSNSSPEHELRIKKEILQKRYSSTGEHSPGTTSEDYKLTQKGLGLADNSDEEFTWADEEIDKFLPKQLRLNKL